MSFFGGWFGALQGFLEGDQKVFQAARDGRTAELANFATYCTWGWVKRSYPKTPINKRTTVDPFTCGFSPLGLLRHFAKQRFTRGTLRLPRKHFFFAGKDFQFGHPRSWKAERAFAVFVFFCLTKRLLRKWFEIGRFRPFFARLQEGYSKHGSQQRSFKQHRRSLSFFRVSFSLFQEDYRRKNRKIDQQKTFSCKSAKPVLLIPQQAGGFYFECSFRSFKNMLFGHSCCSKPSKYLEKWLNQTQKHAATCIITASLFLKEVKNTTAKMLQTLLDQLPRFAALTAPTEEAGFDG